MHTLRFGGAVDHDEHDLTVPEVHV